jgi:hypothetical protein
VVPDLITSAPGVEYRVRLPRQNADPAAFSPFTTQKSTAFCQDRAQVRTEKLDALVTLHVAQGKTVNSKVALLCACAQYLPLWNVSYYIPDVVELQAVTVSSP